jgi:hypothetical protein
MISASIAGEVSPMAANDRMPHQDTVVNLRKLPQRLDDVPPTVRELQWEQARINQSVRIDVLADAHFRSMKSPPDLLDEFIANLPTADAARDTQSAATIRRLSDQYLQQIACLYYLALVPIFQKQYGKIIRAAHINEPEPCYIVLTASGEMFVSGNLVTRPDVLTAEERNIILDCFLLSREVKRVVRFSQGRQTCGDAIFSVVATLLNAVSERFKLRKKVNANGHQPLRESIHRIDMAFIRARYRQAVDLCKQFGIRDSRCLYLYALIVATILTCICYSVIVLRHWLPPGLDAAHFIIPANCALAGTVGAAVSMMTRVTRGSLDDSYRAGQVLLILAAVFRPLIGLVFAFIIYALIQGKLTPFITPPTDANVGYFYIAIGFIAGFSERLVPRLIASTEENLLGSDTTPGTTGHSTPKTSEPETPKATHPHAASAPAQPDGTNTIDQHPAGTRNGKPSPAPDSSSD